MTSLTVVWIDDQPESIAELARGLEVGDTIVEVKRPSELDVIERAVRADAVVLDLNWDHDKVATESLSVPSSFVFLRELSARKPVPAIVYSSAFFSNEEFAKIERNVSPLTRSTRIDKSQLVMETRFEGAGARGQMNLEQLKKKLVDISDQARHLSRSVGNLAMQPQVDRADSPWTLSVDEYLRLSIDEKFSLADQVADESETLVDKLFDETAADWLLIGGARPTVVRWGTAEDRPNDNRILDIGRECKHVVYFFSKPMQLD